MYSINNASLKIARENGVTGSSAIAALLILAKAAKPLKTSELSKETGVTTAATTGTLDRLVKQDLVERFRPEDDRRKVMVMLTPKGAALVADCMTAAKLEAESAAAA
jgi:MarR family transcriptional regulator, transcriptional regulator for hemolysin